MYLTQLFFHRWKYAQCENTNPLIIGIKKYHPFIWILLITSLLDIKIMIIVVVHVRNSNFYLSACAYRTYGYAGNFNIPRFV